MRALLALIQLHPRPGTFPLYVHYIHLHSVLLVGVKMKSIQPSRDCTLLTEVEGNISLVWKLYVKAWEYLS